jgi:hypothetical protein
MCRRLSAHLGCGEDSRKVIWVTFRPARLSVASGATGIGRLPEWLGPLIHAANCRSNCLNRPILIRYVGDTATVHCHAVITRMHSASAVQKKYRV